MASLFADTTPLRTPDFRRLWLAGIPTVIGVWGVAMVGFGLASGLAGGHAGSLLWIGALVVGGVVIAGLVVPAFVRYRAIGQVT